MLLEDELLDRIHVANHQNVIGRLEVAAAGRFLRFVLVRCSRFLRIIVLRAGLALPMLAKVHGDDGETLVIQLLGESVRSGPGQTALALHVEQHDNRRFFSFRRSVVRQPERPAIGR